MAQQASISVLEDGDPIAPFIAAGDFEAAIAQCVALYGDPIGRFSIAILGSQSDADEATQETFVAAYRAMSSYRGECNVRGWLFGIARRQCARISERENRPKRFLHLLPPPVESTRPDAELALHRQSLAVQQALAQLKPSERDVLVLHYQAGLSFREIADICGIEESAARKRASRGLVNLRIHFGAEE